MTTATNQTNSFAAAFEAFVAGRANGLSAEDRRAAFSKFAEDGFPTTRDEQWRFTNIAPVARTEFRLAEPPSSPPSRGQVSLAGVRGLDSIEIVFVNGVYSPELSSLRGLPEGVVVLSLADAMESHGELVRAELGRQVAPAAGPFQALNMAFAHDGAFVHVPRGVVVERPLEMLFLTTCDDGAAATFPRNLVVVGENAQLTLLENYEGVGPDAVYLTNAVTEIVVGESAVVDYYRLQCEARRAYHFGTLQVELARSANFSSHAITLGAAISRNDLGLTLVGENAEGTLNGLYMIGGKQLGDTHTRIDHAVPNCLSHELYKGILQDDARGVFNGYILVRPDAQKTDAKQTNKTLLLSPTALINTNPQLEIYADDVKCTHGATIGQLEESSVFYLRSRGIAEQDARCLLTYAFANDIIRRIRIDALRSQLEDIVLDAQGVKAKPSALEVR